MGKQFYFDKKSYVYLQPSEEEVTSLIVEYLRNCPKRTAGMMSIRKDVSRLYQELYKKPLYSDRFRWGLALLLAVRRPPLLQVWEIKRKRYVKIL